jgi:radical SAM protein
MPAEEGTMIARARLAHAPRVAIWEVTRACALRCRHCRACAIPKRDPDELGTAEAYDLIDQLCELAPGVLVLTGGDPLERPDLLSIVRVAVRRGLPVAVAPSVTPLLTADALRRLADAGVGRIALSLDGPDGATHDGMRGVPGSFVTTLRAMATVRALEIPLQLNTSLDAGTVDRLPATADLVAALSPELWSVFFVVAVGRAGLRQQLDAATCERVFHFLAAWSERTGVRVKTTAAPAYRRVVLQREAGRGRQGDARRVMPWAVNDANGFVFVSHTGDVQPSGFLPLVAGNVRRSRLATIYRTSPLFRALRDADRLEGKCGACSFRYVCGGSRARAFATTGNAFAEDPACVYQPPTPATPRAT